MNRFLKLNLGALILSIVVLMGCTQEPEKPVSQIKKDNAVTVEVHYGKDSNRQTIVIVDVASFTKGIMHQKTTFCDTLPHLGYDTLKIEDDDGNDKDTIVDKPYDIYFSSKNIKPSKPGK